MQKLYIKHLGPIEECEINIDEFMVCTGPQASGKSTIAKSIFFFKNIKNILFVEYKKKYLLNRHVAESRNVTVKQRFMKEVRANFLQIFGITGSLDGDMFLQYQYTEKKILKVDPFQVLDQRGVGQLIEIAVKRGRAVRPDLKCGICGEHGGEPSSVKFCHHVGLNYVSCSPFRVPIARLAAAQAAIANK